MDSEHHRSGRRAHRRGRSLGGLALVVALGVSACGGDDGDGSTGEASGVGNDSAAHAASCRPVGQELEARATASVAVELGNFAFTPSQLTVGPGVVTFAVTNTGSENHELAFLPGDGEVPLTEEGEPDEDALADAGAFELEAFGPGQTCRATYDLTPGTYTLFCIVASPDGRTHYQQGMRGRLVVA